MNDNVDPRTGVHRVRKKRGHKSKRSSQSEGDQDIDYHRDEGSSVPATSAGYEAGGPVYDQQQPMSAPAAAPPAEPTDVSQYM